MKNIALLITVLTACMLSGCDNVQKVMQSVTHSQNEEAIPSIQDIIADWSIRSCELTYRGKVLVLGSSIVEWEKVLGKHDRFVNEIYIFDKLGLKLYERDKNISDYH